MKLRLGLCVGCSAAALTWVFACSPGVDDTGLGPNEVEKGGEGSGANGSGASGDGSGDDGGTMMSGPMGFGGGSSGGEGGSGGAEVCGETALEPEAIEQTTEETVNITCTAESPEPIALYLVLDNSGSMDDNNKWTDAVNAITSFVNSDTAAQGAAWTCTNDAGESVPVPADLAPPGVGSISVAIQYFHPENVGSNPDECDGSGHSTPAVPMAPLPGNATAITDSLASTGPGGYTPTVGALTGGVAYCQDYQLANPEVRCVTVLITDGQPYDCGLSADCGDGTSDCVDPNAAAVLTPIAGAGYTDANSVITFTVGMQGITAAGFDLLDAIAVAGGSDCTPTVAGDEACNVTGTGGQGLLDALNTIRQTVQVTGNSTEIITSTDTVTTTLPCEWEIPEPDDGEPFNKDLVNVMVTLDTQEPQRLGKVASEAECATVGGGWYYNDENAPTRILACGGTCSVIENTTNVRVNVLLGCASEPAIPR